jgi:hypothetical protein
MKTPRLVPLTLMTIALSWIVLAQGSSPMREGQWEVTMKMNLQGIEMPLPAVTQCVTKEQLKDPQAAVLKDPGSDCRVSDYKLAGSTATYALSCTKPQPMTAKGEISYSGSDNYKGTLTVNMGGQQIAMSMDAKRLGDCPK